MYIGEMLYLPLMAVIKLSLLLFFERVFFPNPKLKLWTRIGIISCVVFYTAIQFRAIFQCDPLQKIWNPLLPGHCLAQAVLSYTTGIFNFTSDIYILVVPMPLIWGLRLETSRKLRVMAIFGIGLL